MRSKQIASVAAFVIAFTFAVNVTPQTQPSSGQHFFTNERVTPERPAMTKLLQKDIRNGLERIDHGSKESYPQRVADYIEESSALDDSHTPLEFQQAWHEHLDAWRNYSRYLNSLDAEELQNYRDTAQHQRLNAEISRTWFEVLDITRNYGAKVPANAY